MKLFDMIAEMGHEQLVLCNDNASGYRGIIAIHSTTLGPALGGTRFWQYANDEEAIVDALRLARGMTYKNAVARLKHRGCDNLQHARGRPQRRWGQVGHHRQQQDARPRDDLPRAWALRRVARRAL